MLAFLQTGLLVLFFLTLATKIALAWKVRVFFQNSQRKEGFAEVSKEFFELTNWNEVTSYACWSIGLLTLAAFLSRVDLATSMYPNILGTYIGVRGFRLWRKWFWKATPA